MVQVNSFSTQHCPSRELANSTERLYFKCFHTYLNICTSLPNTGSVADNVLCFQTEVPIPKQKSRTSHLLNTHTVDNIINSDADILYTGP